MNNISGDFCVTCGSRVRIHYGNEGTNSYEPLSEELEQLLKKKDVALKLARDTLSFVESKAPGYDWNADPLSLTLKIGEVFSATEEALK